MARKKGQCTLDKSVAQLQHPHAGMRLSVLHIRFMWPCAVLMGCLCLHPPSSLLVAIGKVYMHPASRFSSVRAAPSCRSWSRGAAGSTVHCTALLPGDAGFNRRSPLAV